MNGIKMKAVDLGELYGLLEMYGRVYDGVPKELLEHIETAYKEAKDTGGSPKGRERITNPRGAGRKSRVTEEEIEKACRLYGSGYTIRETAKEMGCSVGYVHKLIHKRIK